MAHRIEYARISDSSPEIPHNPIGQDAPGRHEKLYRTFRGLRPILLKVAYVVTFVSACAICFAWGRRTQTPKQEQLDWLAPPGTVNTVLKYQKPFALRSGNESDAAWASIFPRGGGYILHPGVSAEPTCLAVYHQLHCLDAIRNGYWAAIDGVEPDHHARPAHVRHCIDYIRQSLMCHMDTNLEPVNPVLNGVTGFDSPKMCRDYWRLTAWADDWRARDEKGFNT